MGEPDPTLIRQAKRAFGDRNVEMARDLVRQDDVVDNLNRECFQLALEIGDDADRREWAMTMLLVARAIERIGDNAVDIGEQVAFVVTGLFREFEDASHPAQSAALAGFERRLRSEVYGKIEVLRDALRGDRHRLQHHARARRRAAGRPAEEGDGAAGLHADQQGARRRRRDRCRRRSTRSAEVVATQVRLARSWAPRTIRAVATAAVREAANGEEVARGDRRGGRGPGRDPQRGGGGAALLHRRDQDARASGRRARSASSTSAVARPR